MCSGVRFASRASWVWAMSSLAMSARSDRQSFVLVTVVSMSLESSSGSLAAEIRAWASALG